MTVLQILILMCVVVESEENPERNTGKHNRSTGKINCGNSPT